MSVWLALSTSLLYSSGVFSACTSNTSLCWDCVQLNIYFADVEAAKSAYRAYAPDFTASSDQEACSRRLISSSSSFIQGGGSGQIWWPESGLISLSEFSSNTTIVMVQSTIVTSCGNLNGSVVIDGTRNVYGAAGIAFECTAPVSPIISLSGLRQTRPSSTGGTSTVTLSALVTENNSPKANAAVQLSVEVQANSGGHEHDDRNRPKGSLSRVSGVTNASGILPFSFQAPTVAGIHRIKATCTGCNGEATHEIEVRVPNLIEFTADLGTPPAYTLRGQTPSHPSNLWLTQSAIDNLRRWIAMVNGFDWRPVGVNDASLIWGGKFDIRSNWAGSHAEHLIGEEVDISFAVGVTSTVMSKSYDESCRVQSVSAPVTVLWHDIPLSQGGAYPPHFHLRLTGGQACSKDSDKKK